LASVYPVYVEVGTRRVFAGAIDWPGWCRSGRDQDAALQALVDYGPRYRSAVGGAKRGFTAPSEPSAFEVVERLRGDATTDFGAPGIPPAADRRPVDDAELERLAALLKACWRAFDRAVSGAVGAVLRKGPRGGGRELDGIVRHVLEADQSYLKSLGGRVTSVSGGEVDAQMDGVRKDVLDAVRARVRGDPLPPTRRSRSVWTPRYGVRRSAWHALDHAWEIEDRAAP